MEVWALCSISFLKSQQKNLFPVLGSDRHGEPNIKTPTSKTEVGVFNSGSCAALGHDHHDDVGFHRGQQGE